MKYTGRLFTLIALLAALPCLAATAALTATAKKGPVQVTLRLHKSKVKLGRSLWYRLELKNVGKKALRVEDRVFLDPWAIYKNSRIKSGLYLEVLDPDGEPLTVRAGGDRQRYDWQPPAGEDYSFTPAERAEIVSLKEKWKREGKSLQEIAIAEGSWLDSLVDKKNLAERIDPRKQLWLAPGRSTATVAWSDRGPGQYVGREDDDVALAAGYTQLWTYALLSPGKYRVRAVYDHAQPESAAEFRKKYGFSLDPAWVKFQTSYLEFEVLK